MDKTKVKKIVKISIFSLLGVIGLLLLIIIGYVLYVVIQYNRIDDKLNLSVNANSEMQLTGTEFTVSTYNIGFGAYSPEYSFFMDTGEMLSGKKTVGKYGKGISKADVQKNTDGSVAVIKELNTDFVFVQEVDEKADRSYGIHQRKAVSDIFGYGSVYAENFHSAYLFYPLNDPHGKTDAGIMTLSKYRLESAQRRSFPVDSSFPAKFFDLDRCFSLSRINAGNSKELVLINLHMSAYDKGGTIRAKQLKMLNDVLKEERDKGNYVVAGGDFNHDIANSRTKFPTTQAVPEWTYPLDNEDLSDGFSFAADDSLPTCRGADIPYTKGVNHTVVIDGFIVSDNVEAISVENKNYEFLYSDHQPAVMKFRLK